MLRRLALGLAALFLLSAPALAQPSGIAQKVAVCDPKFANNCSQGGPFVPDANSTATLSVTGSSANVALPGTGQTVIVTNSGSTDAYVKLGGSSVTAATTDFLIRAGGAIPLLRQSNTYLAGITASGGSTLVVQTGNGSIQAGVTASGGGSAITNYALETGGNLAAAKTDLDALVAAAANPAAIFGTNGTTIASSGNPFDVIVRANSAIIGKVGIDQTTPGTTNAVQIIAGTTGGATSYGLQTAASTNSTNVKNAAGVIKGMTLVNTTTTIYYLRMYDSSSAPTCSSATNYTRTWPIPPAASAGLAGGITPHLAPEGVQFSNGISFCVTGGPSSTDNTNAATGVFINLDYK